MALNVISNFAANVAHRHLTMSDKEATESVAKLSAGTRVLSAKDDAAAMAIGVRLDAEAKGLTQAGVNAGQATSMLQIADGGMARVQDVLTRMKTLAIQAASGQLSQTERGMLNEEFGQLQLEIDRIAEDTAFNETTLLNNSSTISFKVGTGVGGTTSDDIQVTLVNVTAANISANSSVASGAIDITGSTAGNATTALQAINGAISSLAESRATLGAMQNRLEFAQEAIATTQENTEAARSQLMDLDVAKEMSKFTSKQILVQAGTSMLAQANQMPQNLLSLFR